MENNTKDNTTILVVGATGILGLEIGRQLIEKGKQVKGLVRSTSDPGKVAYLKTWVCKL